MPNSVGGLDVLRPFRLNRLQSKSWEALGGTNCRLDLREFARACIPESEQERPVKVLDLDDVVIDEHYVGRGAHQAEEIDDVGANRSSSNLQDAAKDWRAAAWWLRPVGSGLGFERVPPRVPSDLLGSATCKTPRLSEHSSHSECHSEEEDGGCWFRVTRQGGAGRGNGYPVVCPGCDFASRRGPRPNSQRWLSSPGGAPSNPEKGVGSPDSLFDGRFKQPERRAGVSRQTHRQLWRPSAEQVRSGNYCRTDRGRAERRWAKNECDLVRGAGAPVAQAEWTIPSTLEELLSRDQRRWSTWAGRMWRCSLWCWAGTNR